jgi:hypothetical protein
VLRITWDDVSAHSAEVVSQVAASPGGDLNRAGFTYRFGR